MLSSNLVKPKVSVQPNSRRKPQMTSSTPVSSNVTTIIPDTAVAQSKADRVRKTNALRKKLIISSEDDLDTSHPEEVEKVPSMESIQQIHDSSGVYKIVIIANLYNVRAYISDFSQFS